MRDYTAAVPNDDPSRILLIKPSSLGDIIHALPVLAGLRRRYPDAHIAWLVASGFATLLEGHPLLNEVIRFDRARFGRMLTSPRISGDFLRFVGGLRRKKFDLVIDLQGLIRSGFLAAASGASRRVGFADARELAWAFYTQRVRCPADAQHAVEKNLCIAEAVDARHEPAQFPLALQPAELEAVRRRLDEAAGHKQATYTCVLPGARWDSKLWPADRFAGLIDLMHQRGIPRVVLLGAASERALADQIRVHCRSHPISLVGQTNLRELACLISQAALVVCLDSGPMHIAAALDKPTIALFGSTDPARTGPWSSSAEVVRVELDCSPCLRRVCPLRHHRCLRDLTVERVANAVSHAWSALTGGPAPSGHNGRVKARPVGSG